MNIIIRANGDWTAQDVKRWMGQPVCVVLKDGSHYVGWISEVENGELTLSGKKGQGRLSPAFLHKAEKAQLSGFLPGMLAPMLGGGGGGGGGGFGGGGFPFGGGSPFGGGNAAGNAGFGGFMGMFGKIIPGIKMGFGILRWIMPLFGGLKI